MSPILDYLRGLIVMLLLIYNGSITWGTLPFWGKYAPIIAICVFIALTLLITFPYCHEAPKVRQKKSSGIPPDIPEPNKDTRYTLTPHNGSISVFNLIKGNVEKGKFDKTSSINISIESLELPETPEFAKKRKRFFQRKKKQQFDEMGRPVTVGMPTVCSSFYKVPPNNANYGYDVEYESALSLSTATTLKSQLKRADTKQISSTVSGSEKSRYKHEPKIALSEIDNQSTDVHNGPNLTLENNRNVPPRDKTTQREAKNKLLSPDILYPENNNQMSQSVRTPTNISLNCDSVCSTRPDSRVSMRTATPHSTLETSRGSTSRVRSETPSICSSDLSYESEIKPTVFENNVVTMVVNGIEIGNTEIDIWKMIKEYGSSESDESTNQGLQCFKSKQKISETLSNTSLMDNNKLQFIDNFGLGNVIVHVNPGIETVQS